MGRLRTLKPKIGKLQPRAVGTSLDAVRGNLKRTLVGNRLQKVRFEMWKADPHCKHCGRLVEYPRGFELDHIVANAQGGTDDKSNLQILCIDEFEPEEGCHAKKTKQDNKDMRGG